MKPRNYTLLLLFLFCAADCTHRAARPVEKLPLQPQVLPGPLVPADRLDKKIRSLEQISADQSLSAPQRAMAKRLLDSCRFIQDISASPRNGAGDGAVVEELLNSLDRLEESFFAKMPVAGVPPSGPLPLALYMDRRNEILRAHLAGTHARVIQLSQKLEADYGAEALRGKVGLAYVLSLAREDMAEEALSTINTLKDLDETEPDRLLLEAKIAEWQLKLGLRDKAASIYGDMSRSLNARGKVVEALGKKIEETRQAASEPPPSQAPLTPAPTGEPLGPLFARVSEQIKDGRFDEAREMLLTARRDVSSTADALSVDQALAEVDAAEEKYLSERIAGITRKKDALESTRHLLEKEQYRDAVAGIEALEAEKVHGPEIAALKEQAIEKYIHEERNRAAKAFLMARQSEDREQKAEYLRKSLKILKQLVEKYPTSNLINKINSNIKSVEDEMTRLGIQ